MLTHLFYFIILFLRFIYLLETEHKWGEGQKERERENLKRTPRWAQSPRLGARSHDPEIMTKPKSRVGGLTNSATQGSVPKDADNILMHFQMLHEI